MKTLSLVFEHLSNNMAAHTEIVLGLSGSLFWDTDPQTLELEKHAKYIIERVLTRGSWDEFKKILNHYGKKSVGSYACEIRYLDKKTLAFCVSYFNISKEKFKCYTQQQLNPTHWDY